MRHKKKGIAPNVVEWQRLSPLAILHFAVTFVLAIIKQGPQAIVPLVAVLATTGDLRWLILGIVGVVAVVSTAVGSILSYLRFRYRIDEKNVLIQSGVLTRKRLSVSFDRIQNVAFKEPIYFRPFGLVILSLESAGSSGKEVTLAGITRPYAEILRSAILSHQSQPTAVTTETAPAQEAQTTIIRQPISELVRYGLSNNNIWVFAGIAAGSIAQIDFEDISFLSFIEETLNHLGLSGAGLLIFIILFVATLLMIGSVIGAIIVNYDYHLTESSNKFHRTKGLFERQETSLKLSKVQSLVYAKPWPAALLHRYHINLKQVGFQSKDGIPNKNNFIIPSVTTDFTKAFSKHLYTEFEWASGKLKSINSAFSKRYILWVFAPIAIIAAIALTIMHGPSGLLALTLPIISWPAVELRRRQYGYGSHSQHGIIRSGFLGHKLTLFPFYKVQSIQLHRSPGQRKKGLATLVIKLAGDTLVIPYISLSEAEKWRDQILYTVEKSKTHWM